MEFCGTLYCEAYLGPFSAGWPVTRPVMVAFGVRAQAFMKISEMAPRPTGAKPTGLLSVGAPVTEVAGFCAGSFVAASVRAESLVKARRSIGLMGINVRLSKVSDFRVPPLAPSPLQNIHSKGRSRQNIGFRGVAGKILDSGELKGGVPLCFERNLARLPVEGQISHHACAELVHRVRSGDVEGLAVVAPSEVGGDFGEFDLAEDFAFGREYANAAGAGTPDVSVRVELHAVGDTVFG